LFAQNNLQMDEQQLFNNLFEIMLSSLPKPDLLIYLYSNVDRLQQNIKKRGREFEQEITDEYLQNIQNRYLDYLRKQNHFPVLLLDISKVDFKEDEKVYSRIKQLLENPYELGVYQFNLAEPML
jgi:deoxyguanosine kinase